MKDISLIIARCLLKVAKMDEQKTLARWKDLSKENEAFADQMETFWQTPVVENPDKRLSAAQQRLAARLQTCQENNRRRFLGNYLVRIAAVIAFTISIAGLAVYLASEKGIFQNDNWIAVSTDAGQQSKLELPDGSLVWLNAETNLRYNSEKGLRIVNLSGEAYFEVKHAPYRPFVVQAGGTQVKVLGTKFNVSRYPDSKLTEASLLSGKITMSLPGNSQKIELQPGEKLVYREEEQDFSKTSIVVQNEIMWREGVLVFNRKSFNSLIRELERHYGVTFVYEKDVFENIHYTGTINNLSISKVLELINLTIPINYEIENKNIKLSSLKKE